MKIEKLGKEAVRKTRQIEDFIHLSNDELKRVVGGNVPGDPIIDPATCAIHFYYPSDTLD